MKQAIGYCRVSTEEQATEGVSLGAQRKQIETWCKANGYDLIEVYIDAGLSGRQMRKREGLQKALKAIGKDTALVAYSISRLARSLPDMLSICEQIDRKGGDLVSLTEQIDTTNAAGRMMFNMLAAFAQYESEIIGERTKSAMQYKRSKGEKYCHITPFGYVEINGSLIEVDKEIKIVKKIIRQHQQGNSLRDIASNLNKTGTSTKLGGKWHASTVSQLIKRHAA